MAVRLRAATGRSRPGLSEDPLVYGGLAFPDANVNGAGNGEKDRPSAATDRRPPAPLVLPAAPSAQRNPGVAQPNIFQISGSNTAVASALRPIANPANAPATSLTCMARAVPMP
jgi:hypothetical protein